MVEETHIESRKQRVKVPGMTPVAAMTILAVTLVIVEFGVMYLLPFLPPVPLWAHNFLDSMLMLVGAAPALYFLVLRPLHRNIASADQLMSELRDHRALLESVVQERTAQLEIKNQELKDQILELRKAQAALVESQERIKFVLEGSCLGTWERDLRREEMEVHEPWANPLGDRLARAIDRTGKVSDFVHPQDRTGLSKSFLDHLEGRTQIHEAEYQIMAEDKNYCWIQERGKVVLRDPEGRPLRMSGTYAQIGERKRLEEELRRSRTELETLVAERTRDLGDAVDLLQGQIEARERVEKALRESERRYRVLFELAPMGIGLTDERGEVLEVNRCMAELFGVTIDRVTGMQSRGFYEDPLARDGLMIELARAGQILGREIRLRRADGTPFDALLYLNRIELSQDSGSAILSIIVDITQRKRDEARIRVVRDLLELYVTKPSRQAYLEAVAKQMKELCGAEGVGIQVDHEPADGNAPFACFVGLGQELFAKSDQLPPCPDAPAPPMHRGSGDAQFVELNRGDLASPSPSGPPREYTHPSASGVDPSHSHTSVEAGYGSVLRVAFQIREPVGGEILLVDRRISRFTQETYDLVRGLAPLLGEAMCRFSVEEALRQSEHRFQAVFSNHHEPMLFVDPKAGRIVDANPAAAGLCGVQPGELNGTTLEAVGLPLPSAFVWGIDPTQGGRQFRRGAAFRRQDGEIMTLEVQASRLSAQGNGLVFLLLHDLTARKRLEEEILAIGELTLQRVGRELHDLLGSKLAGIALLAKVTAKKLADRSPAEAEYAQEIVQNANEAIAHTRTLAQGLWPISVTAESLCEGLYGLADEVAKNPGVVCEVYLEREHGIRDDAVAAHLFRIAQEAVSNALRHGDPRHLLIHLDSQPGGFRLRVRNDGNSFAGESVNGKGLGLRTMRYRAGIIGANLQVLPVPGGGTEVICSSLTPSGVQIASLEGKPAWAGSPHPAPGETASSMP